MGRNIREKSKPLGGAKWFGGKLHGAELFAFVCSVEEIISGVRVSWRAERMEQIFSWAVFPEKGAAKAVAVPFVERAPQVNLIPVDAAVILFNSIQRMNTDDC